MPNRIRELPDDAGVCNETSDEVPHTTVPPSIVTEPEFVPLSPLTALEWQDDLKHRAPEVPGPHEQQLYGHSKM